MMLARRLAVAAVVLTLLGTFTIGCGPKPPCPVPPTEVKTAQDKSDEVKTELDAATAERQKLEKELSSKEAELKQLRGKPAELEKKLDALKKGSGR